MTRYTKRNVFIVSNSNLNMGDKRRNLNALKERISKRIL